MANFTALKTAINNAIKTNGNEEITGAILQAILDAMVETLGDSAINDLENAITTEVTNRENAVGGVADDLAAEVQARQALDYNVNNRINAEEYNRQNADAALSQSMSQGFQTLGSQMTALNAAISALNAAYQNGFLYGGIATPSSSPSNNKCFYIALQGGTYTNFGGVGVVEGINIIKNDSGWKVEHIYDQTTLLNEFYLLRQQVIQAITSFDPIVIEGDVTNAPDEEDLTSNANHLLQFKNNAYSPLEFSGLGRKYLRKNIAPLSESAPFNGFVEGVTAEETLSGTPTQIFWDRINTRFVGIKDGVYYLDWTGSDNYVPVSTSLVYMYNGTPYQWTGSDFIVDETEVPNLVNCLTQDMINEANTIYIIRYDYTLKENITIPANCVLEFDGGSIGGAYTLNGNNTKVIGCPRFNNIIFGGTFISTHLVINQNIFGSTINLVNILSHFVDTEFELGIDIDNSTTDTTDIQYLNIDGNGHIIKVPKLNISGKAIIKNVVFDMGYAHSTGTSSDSDKVKFAIYAEGNNNIPFVIDNCKFTNVNCNLIQIRQYYGAVVNKCEVNGSVVEESLYNDYISHTILLHRIYGKMVVTNNFIKNCFGGGIGCVTTEGIENECLFVGNIIDTVGYGGIYASGGIMKNIVCSDNTVKNTNCFNHYYGGGESSGINFHGFNNINIHDNYVETPNSHGLDLNGDDNATDNRGKNFSVQNNKFVLCKDMAFWFVNTGTIRNNYFEFGADSPTVCFKMLGKNILMEDNVYISKRTDFSWIEIDHGNTYENSIDIFNNKIFGTATTRTNWLRINSSSYGVVNLKDNHIYIPNADVVSASNESPNVTLNVLSKSKIITKRINFSKAEKIQIYDHITEGFTRIKSVKYRTNYDSQTLAADESFSIGLVRQEDGWARDSFYGTFTIPSGTVAKLLTQATGDITQSNEAGYVYINVLGTGADKNVEIEVEMEPLDAVSYR